MLCIYFQKFHCRLDGSHIAVARNAAAALHRCGSVATGLELNLSNFEIQYEYGCRTYSCAGMLAVSSRPHWENPRICIILS
eukprot:6204005-Pleurochrysis_carterae.AAC.6